MTDWVSGNTVTRTVAGQSAQTLTWDVEGDLGKVTQSGKSTASFVYTADGERLVRKQDGAATVYLPGGQELTLTAAGAKKATRYYSWAGQTVAVRTGAGFDDVSTLVNDHHGTASVSITNVTAKVTRRYQSPFGEARGTAPASWSGDHGFLDKPADSTGLTAIGARYYDPAIGRFVSVDPVMDLADPQQWHGYAYAHSSPVTFSDPTGLREVAGDGRHDTREQIKSAVNHTKKGGGWSPPVVDPPVEVKPATPKNAPSCGCRFEQTQDPGIFTGDASDIPFEGLPPGTKVDQSLWAELLSYPIRPAWVSEIEPLTGDCTPQSMYLGESCYDHMQNSIQINGTGCFGLCLTLAHGWDPDAGQYSYVGGGIGPDYGYPLGVSATTGAVEGVSSSVAGAASLGPVGFTASGNAADTGFEPGSAGAGYAVGIRGGFHFEVGKTVVWGRD